MEEDETEVYEEEMAEQTDGQAEVSHDDVVTCIDSRTDRYDLFQI